ncbi:MAG: DUF3313 family protein [Brevundimonas sp.]|uniref:DUF3313 family protein n=1 Tax=Brevundimonas sp. TaxID=1871086 RepID=UPI00277865EA|nr:DUF3313 family protein [Brevundimonas sp.]MDP3401238.1 DUF3313 family protein [Brevundimonas sp.]MDZ4113385.1 DUF3313 family protein [Brevundimonas sp.]
MKLHPMLPVSLGALLVTACGTPGAAPSGLLSNYDGLVAREDVVRASIRQRRDDERAATVERVFLEPAQLAAGAGEGLTEAEIALVLREVDRQVCYEVSERFTVIPSPEAGAGQARVVVSRIAPTGRVASAVSAASGFFIPGPIGVRVPGTLGGLSAEAELLAAPDAGQVAVILWSRDAQAVGTDNPSLSRVGDAVQLAEPFGDAVGDAFAPPDREVRAIADPDPCARYGPRFRPEGVAARFVTGLYSPELSGAAADETEETEPTDEP